MTLMLGVYNRTDASTLLGGSWQATLPITNLQTRVLGQVARSTDALAASTQFSVNLGAERVIKIVSLVNHNFSVDATYRVRGYSDAGHTTLLIDTGVTAVYSAVYPAGTQEWEDPNFWSGLPSAEDLAGYTSNLVVILASNTVAQYWLIEIIDTTNTAGYVQIGRLFIGSAYTPINDAETGLAIGWSTPTTSTRALSGAKYFQARTPYRTVNFTMNVMTVDEGMANFFEIDRRSGIDKEVIYIFDDADTYHALRRRFIGTLKELSPVAYPYPNLLTKAYTIEELI